MIETISDDTGCEASSEVVSSSWSSRNGEDPLMDPVERRRWMIEARRCAELKKKIDVRHQPEPGTMAGGFVEDLWLPGTEGRVQGVASGARPP